MGHITSKDAYRNLEERINWFTQGAPPTESLYKILQVLYQKLKPNGSRYYQFVHLLQKRQQKFGTLVKERQKLF